MGGFVKICVAYRGLVEVGKVVTHGTPVDTHAAALLGCRAAVSAVVC